MVMETETNTKYLLIFDNHQMVSNLVSLSHTPPSCDSLFEIRLSSFSNFFNGEFDPGSGRTLAACLTHAKSNGERWKLASINLSGERVSNA